MSDTAKFGEGSVRIERTFDAPRLLFWQAWTDPKMLAGMEAGRTQSIDEMQGFVASR